MEINSYFSPKYPEWDKTSIWSFSVLRNAILKIISGVFHRSIILL